MEGMPKLYDGGCLCGAIRYRLSDEPLSVYACHCTDCQRQTGTSFALSMIMRRSALDLLQGEPRRYAVTVAGGHEKHGAFCATCATRLWGEPSKFPRVVVIRPGTLDDATWIRPIAHIWTRSAQPWVAIPEGTLTFETQPEDPMALVDAWRDR